METALQKAANTVWAGLEGIAKVGEFGLEVNEKISLDDFRKAFNLLLFLDDRYKVFINFALGDLYNSLDMKHGEKKAQILDTWGEGWYQRLAMLGGVAARIPKFSRHNFKLPWHVYEAASLKSLPEDMRTTMLETAAKEKANGRYITRETLRQSTAPYKKPKKTAQPAWNGGKGGKFGDAADAQEPPQAEESNRSSTTEGPTDIQPEPPPIPISKETLESILDERVEDEDGDLHEGGADNPPESDEESKYRPLVEHQNGVIHRLQAEVDRLKGVLAQMTDTQKPVSCVHVEDSEVWTMLLDELAYRKKASRGMDATLDTDSVGQLALRRGLVKLKSDRGRTR